MFNKGLPDNYTGPVLPGAVCYSAQLNHSELVLQELRGEGYSIRLILGKFLRRLYAKGRLHTEGLYGNLMFKDSIQKKTAKPGRNPCKTGTIHLFLYTAFRL